MACTATCGSSAQAWTHRSPSLELATERVAREVRQARQGVGPASRPDRTGPCRRRREQRRPEPERDGEVAGVEADGLAGVVGRRVVRPARRARPDPRPRPCVMRAAATVQSFSSATRSARVVDGVHVERREVQAVLGSGRDAGLVVAEELRRVRGVGRRPAPHRAAGRRRRRRHGCRQRRRPRRRGGRGGRRRWVTTSDRRGQLRQRLGQRVHRVGERLDVRGRQRRRRRRTRSPALLRVEQRLQLGEARRRSACRARRPCAGAAAEGPRTPTRAPSTLAWKSYRSVRDQYSSSPVTLPVATSSSRPRRRWRSGRR